MDELSKYKLHNADELARRGEQIYEKRYKICYESEHFGEFLAIDLVTESAYLGKYSSEAMQIAHKSEPDHYFHLVRIGYEGAFHISRASHRSGSRVI